MNRYIKAMEIGLDNEKKGIGYFDLVEQLEKELGKFSYESEYTFLNWFVDNFDFGGSNEKVENLTKKQLMSKMADWVLFTRHQMEFPKGFDAAKNVPEILKSNFFLKGQAAKQYLDYVELKESRLAATHARKQSNYSIWIAIGAILISTVLGVISLLNTPESPKPPYDVKVIEDKTRTQLLEQENKELQEELYKAEMMVRVLEEQVD